MPHLSYLTPQQFSSKSDRSPQGGFFIVFWRQVLFFLPFRKTIYWSYSILRSLSGHNAWTSSYKLVPLFLLLHSGLHLNDHVSQSVYTSMIMSVSQCHSAPPQNTHHSIGTQYVPWFFSLRRDRVDGMNISIRSGTLRMTRKAQRMACKHISSK